jgi:hypothetical protein
MIFVYSPEVTGKYDIFLISPEVTGKYDIFYTLLKSQVNMIFCHYTMPLNSFTTI